MLDSSTAPFPVRVAISTPQVTLLSPISEIKLEEGSSSGDLNDMNPECPALSVGHLSLQLYTQCSTTHF